MIFNSFAFHIIFLLDAVHARFRISESHWNEFFSFCLHRTLTQLLCDVRSKHKREQQKAVQTQKQENDLSSEDDS